MFDNYINKYFSLLNLDNSDNDVNLSELTGSRKIPKAIKRFINSEINRIVVGNIDNIRNQSLFDQTNGDLLKLLNRLESEMKNSVRMSSFEFEQFIKNIIEIRFNYICRPLTTLSELIYKNTDEQSLVDIQNLMEYFEEYNYLLEGVSDWYENNLDKSFLSKSEFIDLIKEIDEDYIYNIDLENFLNLIKNLYKVFSYDDLIDNENEELPIESLIIFFSEKGITPILNLLEEEFNNDVLTLSFSRIEELLGGLLSGQVEESEIEEIDNSEDDDGFEELDKVEEVETESKETEENSDDFGELEYFGEEELEELEEISSDKIEEEETVSKESEDIADDFEELEYFGEEELEELEEISSDKMGVEDTDSKESKDIANDFEELEYFGEEELEELEEISSDKVEEEDTDSKENEDIVDDFEELEYFGEEELEELEEISSEKVGEKDTDSKESEDIVDDFEELEYFGEEELEELEEISSDKIEEEDTDSKETEEIADDFEELEYFGEEELEELDDKSLDLDDFLLDDNDLNDENKSEK